MDVIMDHLKQQVAEAERKAVEHEQHASTHTAEAARWRRVATKLGDALYAIESTEPGATPSVASRRKGTPSPAVARVISCLPPDGSAMDLRDVVRRAGIARTNVQNRLRTAIKLGAVARVEHGRYRRAG